MSAAGDSEVSDMSSAELSMIPVYVSAKHGPPYGPESGARGSLQTFIELNNNRQLKPPHPPPYSPLHTIYYNDVRQEESSTGPAR